MNNAMKRYEFNYQQQKVLASGALNGKLGGNRDHNSKRTKQTFNDKSVVGKVVGL